MRSLTALLLPALLLLCMDIGHAETLRVPFDYPTIQIGIDAAVDGDTVQIAPGLYIESKIDLLGKAIVVTGTDPLDSAVVASTVVDGNASGAVFWIISGEETNTVLTGLTIRNGRATGGAGVLISGASPTVTRNVITENSATQGGAGVTIYDSHAVVTQNRITRNTMTDDWGQGAGIRIYQANPVVSNNVISENSADGNFRVLGAGIYCTYYATPTLTENTIINNAAYHGGGIFFYENSEVDVSNTILWGNTALVGSQVYLGADFWDAGSTFSIDYSNVQGGQAGIFVGPWDTLVWGDGNINLEPNFAADGCHLLPGSPMRDAGDPAWFVPGAVDLDEEPRVMGGRIDIGADEYRTPHVVDQHPPVVNPPQRHRAVEPGG